MQFLSNCYHFIFIEDVNIWKKTYNQLLRFYCTESSPKKTPVPEHPLSDDETDIEDLELPSEVPKKINKAENDQADSGSTVTEKQTSGKNIFL